MKQELAVLAPVYGPTLEALEREFTLHRLWQSQDPFGAIKSLACNASGIVTTGLFGCTRAHIEALPELKIISCFGIPHGTVDLAAARARGIVVAYTPDSNAVHVADLAIGMLISVMRKMGECERFVRTGQWESQYPPVGTGLTDKTCGIVGLGSIGRAIAKRARSFGLRIAYHGPNEKSDTGFAYYRDLAAMACDSDILIVTCRATPETRNLIDARILEALGVDGFLINVARGSIVDKAALINALTNKRIAGAALDVYWDEPRVPAKLLNMENVMLLPHIGTTTREIREERGQKLIAGLRAHFSGQPVSWVIE